MRWTECEFESHALGWQTGHTSYTHTGARGGGLQDYIHTQVPEVPECTFSLNPAPPSRLGRLSAKVGVT